MIKTTDNDLPTKRKCFTMVNKVVSVHMHTDVHTHTHTQHYSA